jgi:hypothetical protein
MSMSIKGQKQQAKAQAKAQQNASIAEQQRYLSEMSAMRLRERQEKVAAAQRIQQSTKAAREARATARVSAGEAGVAGLSVDALINDLTRKQGDFNSSIQQQLNFGEVNRTLGFEDASNRTRMNLLSINRPIAQPDYAGAALSGAQTGMSAYSFGKDAGLFQGGTKTTTTASGLGAGATDLVKPLNFNQAYS